MAPRHDPAPHRRWRRPRCSFLLPDGEFIPWHGKPHHEFIERWRQLVREWDERREMRRAAGEADPVCCPRCDGTLTLCERPADFDTSLMTDRWRCENRACAIDEVRAGVWAPVVVRARARAPPHATLHLIVHPRAAGTAGARAQERWRCTRGGDEGGRNRARLGASKARGLAGFTAAAAEAAARAGGRARAHAAAHRAPAPRHLPRLA